MYAAGWAKAEIEIEPEGRAMNGYGMWHHRARGHQTPLYARAFHISDPDRPAVIVCCVDLAMVNHSMRAGVCERLVDELGDDFAEESFLYTCTHTHSSPGGCGYEALYNVVTPGFVPGHLEAVVDATVTAILAARDNSAPTELGLARGTFDPDIEVAWNRSLTAHNRNPEVTPRPSSETHLALNRRMDVICARRDGDLRAMVSLFGVHATCIGNTLDRHDGDNKGYASADAERRMADEVHDGSDPVAIFAQATAGDVSPHFHGEGEWARRKKITGDAEYAYARRNGEHQSELALAAAASGGESTLEGDVDGVFTYVDFTDQRADPRFADGHTDAWTSEPCHGVAFFEGTRVDGRGMPHPIGVSATGIARALRWWRLRRLDSMSAEDAAYFRRLYSAQGAKDILMDSGRKTLLGQPIAQVRLPDVADPSVKELKRLARSGAIERSPMVPTVLPLQIVRIGSLAVVSCPGEFTTIAGRRLVDTVADVLGPHGIDDVLICTYCNDYMGYVTTREEYQEQAYEGGHTIFGQWTLAVFQTHFEELARQLTLAPADRTYDRDTRPEPVPADELALRSNLPIP